MTKEEIKQAIHDYEYLNNGFQKLSGKYVKVVNLKLRKNSVTVDIILGDEDPEEAINRYNVCEYPMNLIQEIHKKLKKEKGGETK